jgi:branched-chain amino acid transport system substrate-binding protein
MIRKLMSVIFAAAVLVVWVGSGSQLRAQTKEITFGLTVPLTGQLSDQGKLVQNAIKVWEKQVNGKGGILGRQVKVVSYDDRSDPTTAVSLYENLLSVDKVDFIAGGLGAPIIQRVSTLAEQNKKLFINGTAYPETLYNRGYKYLFLAAPGSSQAIGTAAFDWLDRLPAEKRPKTVAFVWQDTIAMEGTIQGARPRAQKGGMEIVFEEKYPPSLKDLSPIVTKMKAKSPDLVFHAGYYPDTILMVRAVHLQAIKPKFFFPQPTAAAFPTFGSDLGAAVEGIFYNVWWDPSVTYPGSKEFVEAYKKEFQSAPIFSAALGYAAMQVYETALKATKSLSQDILRDYVAKSTINTVAGPLSFNDKGLPKETRMLTVQWQKGKQVIISPKDVAGGEPVFQ